MSKEMPQPESSSLVETNGDDDDYSSSSEEEEESSSEEEDTKVQTIIDPARAVVFPVLVELLAINVFKTTKQPHDHYSGQMKVYGNVTVEDAAGRFILFDKDKGDSVVIPSDGSLPFGSTSRCIKGPFLALFIELKTEDVEEDLELTNGNFCMDFTWEKYDWFFNRPVSATIDGEDGYTMVNFAVFNKAVQAEIEVSLLNDDNLLVGDQENVVHEVYGQITSRIGNWKYGSGYQKKYFPTMMFDMPEDEPLKLKSGDTFPLLKSVIAVPYDSYVEVDTSLSISGTQVSRSISLDPAVSGSRKVLVNKAISVKVTWHTPQTRMVC